MTVSSLKRFKDFARAEEERALAAIGKTNGIDLLGSRGTLPDRD